MAAEPPDYSAGSTYHATRRHLASSTQKCVEGALEILGLPASVLDLGCGEGAHLRWLHHEFASRTVGVDLAIPKDADGVLWHHGDLRVPVDLGVTFEWVLCWEVAEHLPRESSDILCDSLACHLAKPHGRLLFTAAPPGQRGPGHINCQPQAFWRLLLYDRGLVYQPLETHELAAHWAQHVKQAPWYGRNVQVFAWA